MSRTIRKSHRNHNYFDGMGSSVEEVYRKMFNMRDRYYASMYITIYDGSDEELWEKAKEIHAKQFRDGRDGLTNSVVNTGIKKESNRMNRRNNKRFCNKVLKDEWENEAYPTVHDVDWVVWNWW